MTFSDFALTEDNFNQALAELKRHCWFGDSHCSNQRSGVRYPVRQHTCTFVSHYADSRGAVASYWRNYEHEILVNRLGGLSLPRKSVVRLNDRPDMTQDVYRGRKTTNQQQQHCSNTCRRVSVQTPIWQYWILLQCPLPSKHTRAADKLRTCSIWL